MTHNALHSLAWGFLLFVGAAACCASDGPADAARPKTPAVQAAMQTISAERAKATVERLVAFGTRHTLSDTTSPTRGIGAARTWVKAQLEQAGPRMQASFEEFDAPPSPRVPNGGKVVNVVGVLPGSTSPSRVVEIIAHLDSRNSDGLDATNDAPGANDDASGCAVVLEAARALASAPTCEATVIFLLTSGEEQSLLGAQFHSQNSAFLKDRTVFAVLNNDIVGDPKAPPSSGWPDAPGVVRVFSEGIPRNPTAEQLAKIRSLAAESDSPGRQLARFVDTIAQQEGTAVQPKLVFRVDRFLRGGDHSPFVERGIPAVRFTAVNEDYTKQHVNIGEERTPDGKVIRTGDLPEFVSGEYMAGVSRLNTATLIHLANAPASPTNVRVVTAKLENHTTLRWAASPQPDVAGYEVVWRDTTAWQWQHARDVGNVLEATVPISKDDNFFAVRAYDRDGYRSVVTFAGAERD